MSHHVSHESSLGGCSVPLHVKGQVIGAGERPMAKMAFERLRTRVLPRVSETGNINKREVISPCDQEGRQTEDVTLMQL